MHPCVGVDVSKHHLDWTFGEDGPVEHLPNALVGIRRLRDRLRRQEPALVAVESTGGYERRLVMALQDGGLPRRARESLAGAPLRGGAGPARQDRSRSMLGSWRCMQTAPTPRGARFQARKPVGWRNSWRGAGS